MQCLTNLTVMVSLIAEQAGRDAAGFGVTTE